ncbi:ABC transporter substrate-binding protein [Dongshaea marina]|uniref:ABC transporter substrate-binding protein n=1 Tax=Dongshaea marina TaxID=2047966 RepID=UPI00131F3C53|nr:ABC transporter substrate binding protein [Dongshaea marina]
MFLISAAEASSPRGEDNPYRILLIDSLQGEPYSTVRKSMLAELERLGYVSGKNLQLRYYSLGNSEEKARSLWLRREQHNDYDLVYLSGTIATLAFKTLALGGNKSFVFTAVTDPIGIGVIDDFEMPPKHNFTGVSYPVRVEQRLRFIQRAMPKARTIGLIYADMPHSHSYNRWLEAALQQPEFSHFQLLKRKIPFVKSETGDKRMARLAIPHIKELNSQVDLFISPNDTMGVQEAFAQAVADHATKPLLGLGRKDVMHGWGASLSIFPDLTKMGIETARMMDRLLQGEQISQVFPEWPPVGIAFDLERLKAFGIEVPMQERQRAGENFYH